MHFGKKAGFESKRAGLFVFLVFLVSLVGLASLVGWAFAQEAAAAPQLADNPVTRIVKEVSPAVVNIDVETLSKRSRLPIPFEDAPFFRRFFGEEFERFSRSVPMKGRGSGFIVSKDGKVLTNNHVVDGTDKITVTLSNGKTYEGRVLGKDPTFDLAVIKIDPDSDLTTLELGDSDSIEVGEWVVAIGNPYGLEHTVTVGVISAKNRSIHTHDVNFDGFLQTDAAINPGNSGGPLIDMEGKVIGINTAIVPYAQGLGFAIPVDMAKQIMNDLITYGRAKRGWLGVAVQDLTVEFAEAYGIEAETGVIVGDVFPGSAAERARLQRGDVIVAVNGETVKDVQWFVNKVRSQPPGAALRLEVLRAGESEPIDVTAKLGENPEEQTPGGEGEKEEGEGKGEEAVNVLEQVGVSVSKPTNELRRQYEIESREGLVTVEVAAGSPAQLAGIREGDLILEVNGKKVNAPKDLSGVVKKGNKSVVLLIARGGRTFFASLKLQ
ncbi:MAG: Do family serine endopeptidase [Synergistaceae bacterium]|jgi:serine protease Do|nr:Do family serine endopeptidase [Synergistaceae bacterium]